MIQDKLFKACAVLLGGALVAVSAWAKLPPLSDEAKAKAAEAAARTTWSNKVADYQLCKSMDSVAAHYHADAKKQGKDVKPPVATPPCADPGAFVYAPPPPPAASAASAPAPAPTAQASAQVPAKK